MMSMKFLDNFFRRSPYADIVLQYWSSMNRQMRIGDVVVNNDTERYGRL
jgi:hypothetical protein